jgi:hypothetical protein
MFRGDDRSKWRTLLSSVLLHFQAKPETYDMDCRKIHFTMTHLDRPAKSFITTKIQQEPESPFFHDWKAFMEDMKQLFGEHNSRGVAQRKLRQIKMGDKEDFAMFVVRFQEDDLDSGFNDLAMKSALQDALNSRMLRLLMTVPEAETYSKLVHQCLMLDQPYNDIEAELRLRRGLSQTNQAQGRAVQVVEELMQTSDEMLQQETSTETFIADDWYEGIGLFEDMCLRAVNVSPEQRKYWRDNALCYYCGEKGHFMRQCPKAKQQTQYQKDKGNTAAARGITFTLPEDPFYNFFENFNQEN